jgi:glycosyltransferase involved in cell wall biosynthesis
MEETRLALSSSAYRDALQATGARVVAIPVHSAFSRDGIRRIRAFLQTENIDILHTIGPKADLHGWLAGRGLVRLVSTVHGWLFRRDFKERLHEAVNRWVLRRFDRVIVLSSHYEALLARNGIQREKLVRIPSGFDPSSVHAVDADPAFAAGYLGRLSDEKQVEVFLGAIQRLVARGCQEKFLIAGDGPLRESLRARIESSGLSGQVEMSGYLLRDQFFSKIRTFVLPSRIENLPYTILESMAAGRPVVASRVGGVPDLVEDGKTGLLVPSGDEASLADALESLIRDTERARSLGQAGQVRLLDVFSPSLMVRKTVELYQSVIPSTNRLTPPR